MLPCMFLDPTKTQAEKKHVCNVYVYKHMCAYISARIEIICDKSLLFLAHKT